MMLKFRLIYHLLEEMYRLRLLQKVDTSVSNCSYEVIILNLHLLYGTETQTAPTVSHIGIQCELILPPVITSTPTKAGIGPPKPNIYISDDNDDDYYDDDDAESGTAVDNTQSTVYEETTSASEPESDIPVEKQQTYLVFESALLLLFSICVMCRSTYTSIEKFTIGSFLRIKQICSNCNNNYVWESQPYVGKIPAGNILISAAILYTGSLPAKALRVFSSLNCATITRKTFFRHQKVFLQPAINFIWEGEQKALIDRLVINKQALVLGGDGRADSPGHSAKYGSYSVIDLKQNRVVDLKLVQV